MNNNAMELDGELDGGLDDTEVMVANGGFGEDTAFQAAMRESRALWRQQLQSSNNNNDNINIINDSTDVIGGEEGRNPPAVVATAAAAEGAVYHHDHHQPATAVANGGVGDDDYEANVAAFAAEMHEARAMHGLSDSSITVATKKKQPTTSVNNCSFFSPITKKGSPHPHVTPSPTINQSIPSNNQKKRKSNKTQHLPSKQQSKFPPDEDTQKKPSYITAPPPGNNMLYNRLRNADRNTLSLTDGKNANTHTPPLPTRYTASEIIGINSTAKASAQRHSGDSHTGTALVQNDSKTKKMIQDALAGAHLVYDEETVEPPCTVCGKSPAKTCRKEPEVLNDNGPNGRHQYTLTHCYECSLRDNPEGELFFTKLLCVNRDGERDVACNNSGCCRSKCSKCLSEETCRKCGKSDVPIITNSGLCFCASCLNEYQREWYEEKQEVKLCSRCNEPLQDNRGVGSSTKDICTRKDTCGKWCAYKDDQGNYRCFAPRLGKRQGKITSPYCEPHRLEMNNKNNRETKQRRANGESSHWKDNETDALVGLMRIEAAKGGKNLSRKKIAADFLRNHSCQWTKEQVIGKIASIQKGKEYKGKDWRKDEVDEKKKGNKK